MTMNPAGQAFGRIPVDGIHLDVQRIGTLRPEAPTLVFLHEALGSISIWRDFPQALCTALGVPGVVYSRQGHGHSDPFGPLPRLLDFHRHEAQTVLPALLRTLDVRRPYLVSHSDGATIALLAAAALPVLGCTVMAPHIYVEDLTADGVRAAGAERDRLVAALARHHRDPGRVFDAWYLSWLQPAFRYWNIEAELGAIEAPLLLIQGEDDQYGSVRQIERTALAVARGPRPPPVTSLAWPQIGHTPWREAPAATTEAIVAHARACGVLPG